MSHAAEQQYANAGRWHESYGIESLRRKAAVWRKLAFEVEVPETAVGRSGLMFLLL